MAIAPAIKPEWPSLIDEAALVNIGVLGVFVDGMATLDDGEGLIEGEGV